MQIRLTEEEVNRINSEIKSGEFAYKYDNDKILECIGMIKTKKDVCFMTFPYYKRFMGIGDTIELTKYRLIQIL